MIKEKSLRKKKLEKKTMRKILFHNCIMERKNPCIRFKKNRQRNRKSLYKMTLEKKIMYQENSTALQGA